MTNSEIAQKIWDSKSITLGEKVERIIEIVRQNEQRDAEHAAEIRRLREALQKIASDKGDYWCATCASGETARAALSNSADHEGV